MLWNQSDYFWNVIIFTSLLSQSHFCSSKYVLRKMLHFYCLTKLHFRGGNADQKKKISPNPSSTQQKTLGPIANYQSLTSCVSKCFKSWSFLFKTRHCLLLLYFCQDKHMLPVLMIASCNKEISLLHSFYIFGKITAIPFIPIFFAFTGNSVNKNTGVFSWRTNSCFSTIPASNVSDVWWF